MDSRLRDRVIVAFVHFLVSKTGIPNIGKCGKTVRILLSDVDGTFGKWQLLLSFLAAVAETYTDKRAIMLNLEQSIYEYRMGAKPFKLVMDTALDILPDMVRGLPDHMVRSLANVVAVKELCKRYAFPLALMRGLEEREKQCPDEIWFKVAVTGAPQFVAEPYCMASGFNAVVGCEYYADDLGLLTGERDETPAIRKMVVIKVFKDDCGVDFTGSIVEGDTEADLEMLLTGEYRFAINPKGGLADYIRANPDQRIVIVSDHRSEGVRLLMAENGGRLVEVTKHDVLPQELVKHFPDLPGVWKGLTGS